jgi:hypothetical protein
VQKIPYDQITVGDIPHVAFEVMARVAFSQIAPTALLRQTMGFQASPPSLTTIRIDATRSVTPLMRMFPVGRPLGMLLFCAINPHDIKLPTRASCRLARPSDNPRLRALDGRPQPEHALVDQGPRGLGSRPQHPEAGRVYAPTDSEPRQAGRTCLRSIPRQRHHADRGGVDRACAWAWSSIPAIAT